MYVVAVTVFVQKEHVEDFAAAVIRNARCTRQEPGNLRFDVLQAEDDDSRFLLYEAYRTRDDFVAHQKTDHYLKWKEEVAPWMAQPRQGIRHHSLFFGSEEEQNAL